MPSDETKKSVLVTLQWRCGMPRTVADDEGELQLELGETLAFSGSAALDLGELETFRAARIVLAEDPPEGPAPAPEWIHIFPLGQVHHPIGGMVDFTSEFLRQMVANTQRYVNALPVDWEHKTQLKRGERSPAAAWLDVQSLEVRIDADIPAHNGLWARVERWTEPGRFDVEQRLYRYISGVFSRSAVDRRTGAKVGPVLVNAALTNLPQIDGLAPLFNAQEHSVSKSLLTALTVPLLFASLGFEEGQEVSDKEAAQRVQELSTPDATLQPAPLELYSALGLEGESATEAAALAQVAELKRDLHTARATVKVLEDGVPPGLRDAGRRLYSSDPEAYSQWLSSVERIPGGVLVPPAAKGGAGAAGSQPSGEAHGLDEYQLELCSQHGITPEQFAAEHARIA